MIRLALWYLVEVKTRACTFIFVTQCLEIYNLPVTVLATFISQTLITNLVERGAVWPVEPDSMVFHLIFCIGLGVISFGLKMALKQKDSDKDPVF